MDKPIYFLDTNPPFPMIYRFARPIAGETGTVYWHDGYSGVRSMQTYGEVVADPLVTPISEEDALARIAEWSGEGDAADA